jgi:hypothetical protein
MRVTPAEAPQIARRSVLFVEEKFGVELRYTAESLVFVEAVVDRIRATGASEEQASGLLAGLGCYAGEVLVRHARASWRGAAEVKADAPARFPALLTLPGAKVCDPLACVFARFADPASDGLATLYDLALGAPSTAPGRPPAPEPARDPRRAT